MTVIKYRLQTDEIVSYMFCPKSMQQEGKMLCKSTRRVVRKKVRKRYAYVHGMFIAAS